MYVDVYVIYVRASFWNFGMSLTKVKYIVGRVFLFLWN